MIKLVEAVIDLIRAVEAVASPVVAVLEAIGRTAVGGQKPPLIDYAAEAIEPRVLVAGIAV